MSALAASLSTDGSTPPSFMLRASSLWAVHQELYRSRRVLRPLIKQNDAELGLCLTEAQAALAVPGRSGGFIQWLREQHIARATAYRLIKRYAERSKPKPQNELNRLTETVYPFRRRPGIAPLVSLRGSRLTLNLDPRLQQVFRQTLRYLLAPGVRACNLPEMVCGLLSSQTPTDIRLQIRKLWDLPVSHFTTADFTNQADIYLFPGEPGAIRCA
ncbi:MAG TPA: hypothetical protein VIC32_08980 [Terriglobales bacterium]|jgi:hypothetical protein